MDSFDTARLIYLGLLIVAIGGSYLVSQRKHLGKTLQMGAIWALIILGTVAGVGLWEDVRQSVAPFQTVTDQGQISVPRQGDGHYHLVLQINGTPIEFVVDTGASEVVLTQEDAARVGLDPAKLDYFGRAMTANGPVQTARVVLDEVRLGPLSDTNLRATVNGGEMFQSLLGMSYLNRFSEIAIRNGELVLTR